MNIFFKLLIIMSLAGCMSEKVVYIYSGPGASENAAKQTAYTLEKLLSSKYKIQTIQAKEVIEGNWAKNAVLFVLPGGADLPYVKDLTPHGNEMIRSYVANGGSFLGLCAGAYYAGNHIEFDVGGELEVLGTRELGFFPGTVKGPILKKYDYKTNSGAQAAELILESSKAIVYYNGGGYFVDADKYPNVKIIAKYAQAQGEKAAIININYGKGIVVLSGVHFEYVPELLDEHDDYLKGIILDLKKHTESRLQLGKNILHTLKLETK